MPNVTQKFLNSPILFLHRTPVVCHSEWIGLRTLNMQLIWDEDVNLAQLRPTPRGEAGVMFYVLGWQSNQVSTGFLGSGARFFFTGPLSGCTFAVDKNWARPRVIHVNQTLTSGHMDVPHMMGSVNHFMAGATSRLRFWQDGPNITVVQSHDRPEDYTYNILGYRSRIGWTFYRQSAEMTGGGKVVRGLEELDTWV
jgi:hypothetical protein